jgi:hypothetical protein
MRLSGGATADSPPEIFHINQCVTAFSTLCMTGYNQPALRSSRGVFKGEVSSATHFRIARESALVFGLIFNSVRRVGSLVQI